MHYFDWVPADVVSRRLVAEEKSCWRVYILAWVEIWLVFYRKCSAEIVSLDPKMSMFESQYSIYFWVFSSSLSFKNIYYENWLMTLTGLLLYSLACMNLQSRNYWTSSQKISVLSLIWWFWYCLIALQRPCHFQNTLILLSHNLQLFSRFYYNMKFSWTCHAH